MRHRTATTVGAGVRGGKRAARHRASVVRGRLIVLACAVLVAAAVGGFVAFKPHDNPAVLSFDPVQATFPSFPSAAQTPRSVEPTISPTSVRSHTVAPTVRPTRRPSPTPTDPSVDTPGALLGTPSEPAQGNLAAGRPVTDTGHGDVYVANNAVDGNPSTYWESGKMMPPQSITVDLSSATTVGRIVMKLPPLSSWSTRTEAVSVSGSTNGSRFTRIAGLAGYTFNPSTGNVATVSFHAAHVRYVRLTFVVNTKWQAAQLSEFEVYPS
jgi:hypothetical protein